MKKFAMMGLFCFLQAALFGQKVDNYDANGGKTQSQTDLLQISIEDESTGAGSAASVTFSGIAGAAVGLVVDYINARIAKRQQSFASTYSSEITFVLSPTQYDDLAKGPNTFIHVKRYLIDKITDELNSSNLVEDYAFKVIHFGADYIQLKLQRVLLIKSRARIKNNTESLTIGVDLKLSCTAPGKTDASGKSDGKSSTLALGESNVKIPVITPGANVKDLSTNKLISVANYQGIPAPGSGSEVLTITASVSEANLDHLTPSTIDNLLKSNGSDISSLLKSFFSSGSTSKSN